MSNPTAAPAAASRATLGLGNITHVIVIYQENWSFDSLYGNFPGADGFANANAALAVNPQIDVFNNNQPLAKLPTPLIGAGLDPNFPNFDQPPVPYNLMSFIPPSAFTGDMIHAFMTQQAQIDGGKNDKYVSLSDNGGLLMGYFDATNLPEGQLAQQYVLCDNFFHAAFGGSYLNHHFLIAAQAPIFPNAPAELVQPASSFQLNGNFGFDANGNPFPQKNALGQSSNVEALVTTDGFSVNTTQPAANPHAAGVPPAYLLPPQTHATIGERLNDAGLPWAWYNGGWDSAVTGMPSPYYIFHHHPFVYFAAYGEGTANRAAHLKDETKFFSDLQSGTLPNVSFIKPLGIDDEHPGYSTLLQGQQHVASIVAAVQNSPYWPTCAIIIAYDENGGHYDHVAPPSAAQNSPAGTYDRFGPGARVPAIIVAPFAKKGFIDHTSYDTTSILRFIEKRWNLAPLGTRDAAVNSLDNAFDFTQPVIAGITANPLTAGPGQPVTFGVNVIGDTAPIAISWDFGDPGNPAPGSGAVASHTYMTAGVYTARVTVSDGIRSPVSGTVSVTVGAPLFGAGLDSDGDRFSDAVEVEFGSDPINPNSTPVGPAPLMALPGDWRAGRTLLWFRASAARASFFEFSGSLPLPLGFNFSGQKLAVDIGGDVRLMTLTARGRSTNGGNSVAFRPIRNGAAQFKARFKGATLAPALVDEGLTNETVNARPVSITVSLAFNGSVYTKAISLNYSAKANRFGLAR